MAGGIAGILAGIVADFASDRRDEKRHVSEVSRLFYTLPHPIHAIRGLLGLRTVRLRQARDTFRLRWQQAVRPVPELLVGPLFEDSRTWRFMMVSADRFAPICDRWREDLSRTSTIIEPVCHINPESDVAMVDTNGVVLRAYLCIECAKFHRAWTRPWVTDISRSR